MEKKPSQGMILCPLIDTLQAEILLSIEDKSEGCRLQALQEFYTLFFQG